MKQLPTRTAQVAADVDLDPVIPSEPIDWQARYNTLQIKYLALLREYQQFRYPPRTEDELEQDMMNVRNFLDSMSPAEGAVTAAGVYSVAFLQREHDHRFVVKLCTELVRRYSPHQSLIQSTFDLWINNEK